MRGTSFTLLSPPQVLGPAYNPAYMAFSLEEPRAGFGGYRGHDPRDTRGTGLDDGGAGDYEQHSSRVLKESPWTRDVPGPARYSRASSVCPCSSANRRLKLI